MKIGIGITTTFRRPKTLRLALSKFRKHQEPMTGVEFVYHIQHFYPKKHTGIAQVKNLCIKNLMQNDCDFLFLFDDDCFPCHDNWWKPFVEAHLRTGNNHFCYISDDSDRLPFHLGRKKLKEDNGITIFRNAQGCCLFFTRHAVLAVGGFDERFTGYGYEHEQFSMRIHASGLNPAGPFLSIPNIENYIYSLDVMGCRKFEPLLGKEVDRTTGKPRTSISLMKMQASLARNKVIFEQPCNILQPLNYD